MTEEQDVLDPRRPRRRTPLILLGLIPAGFAATMLVAGLPYTEPAAAAAGPAAGTTVVANRVPITPGLIAPLTAFDAKAGVQKIIVTVPKPKVVAPVVIPAAKQTSVAPRNAVVKKTAKTSSSSGKSYKSFCANPSNPVSTSGSTGKALLSTVNRERAKLGLRQLTWSSSMASTATSWSKKMLAKDLKTSKLIDGLAHNPNRPGSENVAVIYSSRGYSGGAAVSKLHKNLVYSSGHCLNLMNPNHKSMGAGVAHSSNGKVWYATENFR